MHSLRSILYLCLYTTISHDPSTVARRAHKTYKANAPNHPWTHLRHLIELGRQLLQHLLPLGLGVRAHRRQKLVLLGVDDGLGLCCCFIMAGGWMGGGLIKSTEGITSARTQTDRQTPQIQTSHQRPMTAPIIEREFPYPLRVLLPLGEALQADLLCYFGFGLVYGREGGYECNYV